jgi:hypothetical protein
MPTDSTNPNWIEPPPTKRKGIGCFGAGCLVVVVLLLIAVISLFFAVRSFTHAKPKPIPVEELPPQALADVRQRIDQFEATPPTPSFTPTPVPAGSAAPNETPEPTTIPSPPPGRELSLSAAEINGLIAANPKSRGHAFVSLNGNTANVQISISSDKVPDFPKGYVNGTFSITTNGPTPINGLQVSKVEANGYPVPSGILSMSYRGESIMGMAMDAISRYNVSTAEIRNGTVILH